MPSAASSEMDPEEMASMPVVRSHAPSRMMEPLPNCFSICPRARSIARDFSVFSSAILFFLFYVRVLFALMLFAIRSVLHKSQFFTDKSVELIRACGFPREGAHAFAVALLAR